MVKAILEKVISETPYALFPTAFGYCILFQQAPVSKKEFLCHKIKQALGEGRTLWSDYRASKSQYLLVFETPLGEQEALFPRSLQGSFTSIQEAFLRSPSEYLAKRLAEPLIREGKKALEQGKKKDCLSLFSLAVGYDFHNPKLHFHLGKLLEEEKRWEAAEFHLQRFQELMPDNPMGWFLLGKIALAKKKWEQASGFFAKYIRKRGQDANAFLLYGESLFGEKRYSTAKQALLKALELNPENKNLYPLLAKCYLKLGDQENAKRILKLGISKDPQSSENFYLLGKIYFINGELRKAKKQIKRSLRYNPDSLEAYYLLGEIYQRGGDKRKARKIRERWQLWKKHLEEYGCLRTGQSFPEEQKLFLFEGVEEDDWDDLEEISLEEIGAEDEE